MVKWRSKWEKEKDVAEKINFVKKLIFSSIYEMKKLNPNVAALSLGITTAILSAICFILIAILPMQIVVIGANTLFHGIYYLVFGCCCNRLHICHCI